VVLSLLGELEQLEDMSVAGADPCEVEHRLGRGAEPILDGGASQSAGASLPCQPTSTPQTWDGIAGGAA
jgi:hypothetical protein